MVPPLRGGSLRGGDPWVRSFLAHPRLLLLSRYATGAANCHVISEVGISVRLNRLEARARSDPGAAVKRLVLKTQPRSVALPRVFARFVPAPTRLEGRDFWIWREAVRG
jgi:hypothetical protein